MNVKDISHKDLVECIKALNKAKAERVGGLLQGETGALKQLRDEYVRRVAESVKRQVLDDMDKGTVPRTVRSFSELHDYVDANMYVTEPFEDWNVFSKDGDILQGIDTADGEWATDIANAVMDIVDGWIKRVQHIETPDSAIERAERNACGLYDS